MLEHQRDPEAAFEKAIDERDRYKRERDALAEALLRARNALIADGHRPGLSAPLVESIDPLLSELGVLP